MSEDSENKSVIRKDFLDDFGYDGYDEDDVKELKAYALELERALESRLGTTVEELKPCPFYNLGGRHRLGVGKFDGFWKVCCECGCMGPGHHSARLAIEAWDRRARLTKGAHS